MDMAAVSNSRSRVDSKDIQELVRSLTRLVDTEGLLSSVGKRIRDLFGADLFLALVADSRTNDFTPRHYLGFTPEALKSMGLSARGQLARWLRQNRKCLVLAERLELMERLDPMEQELLRGLRVHVCVPLISLDRLIGMLLLGSSTPDWALDDDEIALLEMLANQLALALENSLLHAQQKERLHRLYLAERLATAGQLAAAVAHEIRNPLAIISSTVQYLVQGFPEDDPKRLLAQQLMAEVARIKQTTEGLTSLGREREPQRIELNILEVLDQALALIEAQRRQQQVEVVKSYGQERFLVLGDPYEFKQVFLNLLLNSLQALKNRGTISIRVGIRESAYNSVADRRVEVAISDTGPGLPPEDQARVFDPFFTTKREGTGLGLFICQSILARYEGEISFESQANEGTTVRVDLPILA